MANGIKECERKKYQAPNFPFNLCVSPELHKEPGPNGNHGFREQEELNFSGKMMYTLYGGNYAGS
jgi:hypothetical protein